jgi:hypothetical protein
VSNYLESDTFSQTGAWLTTTARRNPEALLLVAAGCVLLMRSGGRSSSRTPAHRQYSDAYQEYEPRPSSRSAAHKAAATAGDAISRVGETAGEYASDIKQRISETAGGYAQSASEFAQEAGRSISGQSERLRRHAQSTMQEGMSRVLREKPLAVAAAGLAAGAVIAAVFPSTRIENRALGGAHDALAGAASKAGESLMGAAGKAGERLKEVAAERGLTPDGLANLAGDVAGTFANAVSGKDDSYRGATTVPQGPATGGDRAKNENSRTAGLGPAGAQPGGRSNR